MSSLSYLDLPVLRSHGFVAGASGTSWFGRDRDGKEWQAVVSDNTNRLLNFTNLATLQSVRMDRDKFSKTFQVSYAYSKPRQH